MNCSISSIHYYPVKSLSFQSIKSCIIKKNLGMLNDRVFAFSRSVDYEKAKLIEKNPNERKLNYFLTLKNSPVLNKYNFIYDNDKLTLAIHNKELISISVNNLEQVSLFSNKFSSSFFFFCLGITTGFLHPTVNPPDFFFVR